MTTVLPRLPETNATPADAGFGAITTERGGLPLAALSVNASIDGLFYEAVIEQTFVNVFPDALEATYIFPMPDRAAVTGFRLTAGGRTVEGELCERATARERYDEAINKGQRAAIAEEERPNVFTVRVGNLPPKTEATVRLTLCGPLAVDDGEATWRFPLVVAPRYIPGTPLADASCGSGVVPDTDAVSDASRITPPILLPGFPNPVRLSLEVHLRAGGFEMTEPRSSLHTVVTKKGDDGALHLALQPGERLDRDFVLRFRIGGDALRSALQVHPDKDATGGTFALTIVPSVQSGAPNRPRDIVFLLDRSGSMGGWKMVAARRAMSRMVEALTPADRFTVFAFDDSIETPPGAESGWLTAGDGVRFRAAEYLAKIEARGGTEVAHPLDRAVRMLNESPAGRDRLLVLVTDGQVGNEPQIIKMLSGRLAGIRIFTLGIDQAVNDAFLRQLAQLGGGYTEVVESEERIDAVMAKVQRRLGQPVLTGLSLDTAGWDIDGDTLLPQPVPDLYPGMPLVISGRYRGRPGSAMRVTARDDAGQSWQDNSETVVVLNPAVTNVWARGQVRTLEDAYVAAQHEPSEIERRIVKTSLQFGVLSRFTAWLAVDVQQVVEPGGTIRRVTQPVELPSGWEPEQIEVLHCLMAGAVPGVLRSVTSANRRARTACSAPPTKAMLEQAIFGSMSAPPAAHRAPPTDPAAPITDLSAYRQRAHELADQLPDQATARDVGRLAIQLAELLDDLRSIDATDAERQPLEELLTRLQSGGDANELVAEAKRVLLEFASIPAEKPRSFWKRAFGK